jgi:hypothetical protein
MVNISWQFQAAIQDGPTLALNQPMISVAAYDVVQVTLAAGASAIAVPIQPGSTTGDVVLLVVNSSEFGAALTYTVDAVGTTHVLDGPHLLIGSGAVGFLNAAAPPKLLTFTNGLASSADVQVVVGRNVP